MLSTLAPYFDLPCRLIRTRAGTHCIREDPSAKRLHLVEKIQMLFWTQQRHVPETTGVIDEPLAMLRHRNSGARNDHMNHATKGTEPLGACDAHMGILNQLLRRLRHPLLPQHLSGRPRHAKKNAQKKRTHAQSVADVPSGGKRETLTFPFWNANLGASNLEEPP